MTGYNQSVTWVLTGYAFTRNINPTYGWTYAQLIDHGKTTAGRPTYPSPRSLIYQYLRPYIPNNYYKHHITCPSLLPERLGSFSSFRPIMLAHAEHRIKIAMNNDWVIW